MKSFNPLTSPLAGQRLIEASAGTGKTWSIAFLYLRFILERHLEAEEILVVTFTTAATDELRARIRTRIRELLDLLECPGSGEDAMLAALMSALPDPEDAKKRLQDGLTRMDEAAIYTIHGFCQRMLQEHAFESGIPFEVDFIESEELLRTRIMEDFWRQRFYRAPFEETAWAMANWQGPDKLAENLQFLLTKPHAETVPDVSAQQVQDGLAGSVSLWHEVRKAWPRKREEVEQLLRTDPCLSRSKDNYGDVPLQTALDGMDRLAAMDEMVWILPDKVELLAASVMADAKKLKGKKNAPEHPFFDLFDRFYQCHTEWMRSARIQILAEAHTYLCDELDSRKQQQAQMYFNDLLVKLDSTLAGSRGGRLKQRIRSRFKVALVDEFQDTDPLQYRIFHTLFGQGDDPGLFMIGDPKQSIYSFRGADIFAYIQAARDTPAGSSFTMDTNYRATSPMVAAVNRLFDRDGSFVFTGEIDFHPVRPCPGADNKPLVIGDEVPRPLQIQLLSVEADATPKQKTISKERAGDVTAAWTASEIARLLVLGQRGEARIGDKPVSGGDCAILVRTHLEAELMQQEMRRLNIPSVYYSRDSVYETGEARQVYHILAALLDPADEPQVRNALVTEFFGLDAALLDEVQRDRMAWSTLLGELEEYQLLWRAAGLTAMFHRLLFKRGVVRRFAGMSGGERTLTNFLHLVELLQEASSRYSGNDLVCWFKQQLDCPEKDAANQQLRLESDEDLVKIVTIHKAKGLEYPVVFLPFLWHARVTKPNELFACHVRYKGVSRLVVDFGSGDEELYGRAERERLAEDLRLLYVALTRARSCCYLTWGRIGKMEQTALAWLLHRNEDGTMVSTAELTEEKIEEDLKALNRESKLVCFVPRPAADEVLPLVTKLPPPGLAVRSFTGHIDTSWTVTSFSGLSAHGPFASHVVPPDFSAPAIEAKEERGLSVFTFPKGAVAGNCLHGLLEDLDFTGFTADELQELAQERLKKSGFDRKWAPILVRWIENILATPLDASSALRLDLIHREDRKVEMGFYFALHDFDPGRFNEILTAFSIAPVALAPDRLEGLMKGYIDLLFRRGERYFILDYKSNYLGPDFSFYTPEHLQEAMQEHRYDLQYLIYSVALHRFLKGRLGNYNYERHFGGVFYLFLRGMHPDRGSSSGVWQTLPPVKLVEQLDQCFGMGVE